MSSISSLMRRIGGSSHRHILSKVRQGAIMRKIRLPTIIVAAVLVLMQGAAAGAQTKVWVAFNGVDNASCGDTTSPCSTFQRAHDNAVAGGEVGVLTPGDYGPVAITKAISITNDGSGEAGILVPPGANGIGISAGRGDIIGLRGLVIEGAISGALGIQFMVGSALHAQNCVIRNLEGGGFAAAILFQPTGNSQLFVADSIIFNNGNSAGTGGIVILPIASGSANVALDRIQLENNVVGLRVESGFNLANGGHVVLRDSVVSGNASDGIAAHTGSGHGPAFLFVQRSSSVNNGGNGIVADGPGATVLLSDSTLGRNAAGVATLNGGQLISYGNNRNNNNIGPEGTPTGFYARN